MYVEVHFHSRLKERKDLGEKSEDSPFLKINHTGMNEGDIVVSTHSRIRFKIDIFSFQDEKFGMCMVLFIIVEKLNEHTHTHTQSCGESRSWVGGRGMKYTQGCQLGSLAPSPPRSPLPDSLYFFLQIWRIFGRTINRLAHSTGTSWISHRYSSCMKLLSGYTAASSY